MGYNFFLGIALGGLVGFFVSIFANIATPAFSSYFQRSKRGWIERNKKRALKQFNFVSRFQNGTEDKYMYFVAQRGYILFYSIFAVLSVLFTIAFGRGIAGLMFAVSGTALFILISLTHVKLYLWYWRINNFEQYKLSLTQRWSDLNLQ